MIKTIYCSIAEFINGIIWLVVKSNDSRIGQHLRRKIYGTSCNIDTDVFIKNKSNFSAGYNTAIYHGSYILNTSGKFYIGDNSHLGAYCYVNVCYGSVVIGNDVAIGPGVKIFAYSNHFRKGKKISREKLTADILIKNNVFIGANTCILPGTIINDNVVVGAGAVVKGELKSNIIYAGVPCRQIKKNWY